MSRSPRVPVSPVGAEGGVASLEGANSESAAPQVPRLRIGALCSDPSRGAAPREGGLRLGRAALPGAPRYWSATKASRSTRVPPEALLLVPSARTSMVCVPKLDQERLKTM